MSWFDENQRPLPWRKTYDPYEVWISEVMLQQTQVATALPYFEKWMRAFPTVDALAAADEKKVLKAWEGLGYYSRARNLHESAKTVMARHKGLFPSDFNEILKLKGLGRYSAGAIASIAFNQDKPIVDGNVLRVLSRLYAISKPVDDLKYREDFWRLQESLIPKGKARYFNQALMELGALVCTPKDPACASCPLRNSCKAFQSGRQDRFPVRLKKKRMLKVTACAVVLEKNGRYFIHRRPLGKIMGGLWEFPEWKVSENRLPDALAAHCGVPTDGLKKIGRIKRNYTHHNETLNVFRLALSAQCESNLPDPPFKPNNWQSVWVSKKGFLKYPFSSAHAKIAGLLLQL